MSHSDRILRVLSDGPATSGEVACALHMPTKRAAAQLHRMHEQGRIARSGAEVRLRDADPMTFIYALPEHRSALAH
jgi:hypothetical protein